MATITGTVVNQDFILVGLKARGKHCELYGGSNTTRVEARMTLAELMARKLKTNQVDFSSGQPVLSGNFKLNSLPMEIYLGDRFEPVNNNIEAVGRIVNKNKDVGYEVLIGGRSARVKTENLEKVVQLMHPTNFVIRHSENGNAYVAAKKGAIAELPVILDLSAKVTQQPPAVKRNPVAMTFLEMVDFVESLNGLFAYLPGTAYKAVREVKADDNYKEFKNGQLASPAVVACISNANVNLRFRGIGAVDVKMPDGTVKTLYPQIWREKSVYKNGVLNMENIGILVDKAFEEKVLGTVANSTLVSDKDTVAFLASLVGKTAESVSLISVSLKGVKAYEKVSAIDYMALALSVNAYAQVSESYRICQKLEREYSKANKTQRVIHKSLEGFSGEELSAIAFAGISLKDFSYSRVAKDGGSDKGDKAKEKVMKLDWGVVLTEVAEEKKAVDIEQVTDEFDRVLQSGNNSDIEAALENMKNTTEALKKQIWEANKTVLVNGPSTIYLAPDVNGRRAVDATTSRMRTSKKATVEIGHAAISTLVLTVAQAEAANLVM